MSCQEVANFVCFHQGHLAIPKDCPRILYNVLLSCWNSNVESRPNFDTLCSIFEQLLDDKSLLEGNSTDLSSLLISPTLDVEETGYIQACQLQADKPGYIPLIKAINEVEQHGNDSPNQTSNADEIEEGFTLSKSM